MHPKVRSPLVSWLLTVATGGIYLFFWAWRIARELNSAEKRMVFPLLWWRNTTLVLFGLAAAGALIAIKTNNPLLFFVVGLCLFSFFVYVQISIGNYIKTKDAQLGTGGEFSNAVSVALLWLVANTGVAYMQSGINRIIRHEQARS